MFFQKEEQYAKKGIAWQNATSIPITLLKMKK